MTTKNDGGSAFPIQSLRQDGGQCGESDFDFSEKGQSGMTLRDWFAGKAMQGILAGWNHPTCEFDADAVSVRAGVVADAMISERSK